MAETQPRAILERAAVALRRGDPLTAMRLTDRESLPVALAIRGAALAQLPGLGRPAVSVIGVASLFTPELLVEVEADAVVADGEPGAAGT